MLDLNKSLVTLLKTVDSDSVAVETAEGVQNNSGKKLFNMLTKEILDLKKKVEVPSKVTNINAYKLKAIKEALKAEAKTSYTKSVIDTSVSYLESGYSININETSVKEVKELLKYKPSKASVKKDFKEALAKAKSAYELNAKNEIKAHTPENIKEVCSKMSNDELVALKKYINTLVSKVA